MGAMATEFVIDKATLTFLMADERANVVMYAYDPQAVESRGGLNLIARGDFHVGARINALVRLPMTLPSTDLARHAVWFGRGNALLHMGHMNLHVKQALWTVD